MKAKSASTLVSDSYRAGLALGEELRPIRPEIVLLFSSVEYGTNGELLEGLYDAIGDDDLIVLGCTGDGFYESSNVADSGAGALGLNSEGRNRWYVATAGGLREDPAGAARACHENLRKAMGADEPSLVLLFSDFRTDATRIEELIGEEIRVPVVGGLAADGIRITECFVYVNRQVLTDTIAMVGVGGALQYDITVGNSIPPVGKWGTIDRAAGTYVATIDGEPAMDFIVRETGKPVLYIDRGVVALTVADADAPDRKRLRSIRSGEIDHQGGIDLFGGIRGGEKVRVCCAQPEDLIAEVRAIAERVPQVDMNPAAALIVSCRGRKNILGEQVAREVEVMSACLPAGFPIAGLPSHGEMGPLRSGDAYSRNMFHNMTYVLLLLGQGV